MGFSKKTAVLRLRLRLRLRLPLKVYVPPKSI